VTSIDLRQDKEKDEEEEEEEEEEEVQLPALNLFLQEENRKCTALKFPMLCPLVLLTKLGWRQSTALGNGEGEETGSGMLQYTKQERKWTLLGGGGAF
jgi:hypothetical protein